MTEQAPSVTRWQNCKWSVVFGYSKREIVDAIADAGQRENFGCGKSEVIDQGIAGQSFSLSDYIGLDGWTYDVAVLHGFGALSDPDVISALDHACGQCPYFKDKFS